MCGRAALGLSDQQLVALFSSRPLSQQQQQQYHPNYNIRPTTVTPIIRRSQGQNELVLLKWGIKFPQSTKTIINARSESICQKPMFRSLVEKQRCIMPIIGFYEWTADKRPHLIKVKEEEVMNLACLYTKDDCFVIITCDAAPTMSKIHDRMPVVIERDELDKWLDVDQYSFGDCKSLLRPFKGELQIWPVNPLRGNDESCIKPALGSPQTSITSFMRPKGESSGNAVKTRKRSDHNLESQKDKPKKVKVEAVQESDMKSTSSNNGNTLPPEIHTGKSSSQKQQSITNFFKPKGS